MIPRHTVAVLVLAFALAPAWADEPIPPPAEPPVFRIPPATTVDLTRPEAVVQALFDAAHTGVFEPLGALCDPRRQNDGDTECLCAMASSYDRDRCALDSGNRLDAEQYRQYFVAGALRGAPRIEGDEAEVDFVFGPDGTRSETMHLIRRDGSWFLYSF